VPPFLLRTFATLAGLSLLTGCRAGPARVVAYQPPTPPQSIVLVADGAGGESEAAAALAAAARETGTPLLVRTFDWTHGRGRGVADMTDGDHARDQGSRLAALVNWYRSSCPNTPVYLLAYSAGAHVALEATRCLEPNSLERMVLLAPAVAADYDLGPALAAARQGIDVFSSERDRIVLGLGTRVVGTADGKRGVPPAGRVGFDAPAAADACLAQRLRQHPWDPSIAWTGNTGRHAGSMTPSYFRAFVLPLFFTSPPSRRQPIASHGHHPYRNLATSLRFT
jgi:hypothetical protein